MSNEELKNKKRVNKVFLGFFYTFIVIIGLVVVYMYNLDRNEFYLKEDKVIINKGSSYQIKLTPKNENIFDYLNYIYETEDKSIATVDQFGTVKAVGTGETKLNIRYKYGLENKTMLIKTENVEINSIAIKPETEDGNNEQINIRENENTQVSSEIVGREEVHISVEYRSSDEDVATIDEYGHVEGIEEGTATIIGETEDGVIGEIPVEIEEEKPSIESIEFSEKQITIKRESVNNLTIIKTPINAEEERITYKSDNGNVVVDENGKITGINVGTSTITATSESGKQAFCVVQVIEETKPIENIYLNSTNEEIKVGKSIQLVTTISPSDATEREVVWESSNSNIATVEQNGLVIGKSEGQVVITVKSKDGRVQARCNVTVVPDKIYINTISIQEGNQQLVKGSKIRLTPIITPSNATERVLTWSSSNPSVATVDVTGTVTTKGVGKTTITVKTVNGKETTIEIEVIEEPEEIIEVQKITLDKATATLEKNKSLQLTATISPSNATDKNIEWSSSNTNVATVTNGKVQAKSAGEATITVKTSNGKKTTCKIKVQVLAERILITNNENTIKVGSSLKLNTTIEPSDTTNKDITWVSSDSSIATVDSSGKVTGKKVGNVVITAKTSNGKQANKQIKVEAKEYEVTSISLNPANLVLNEEEASKIVVTINPANATNQKITWKSSNTKIATVDANGYVKAVGKGTVTITATSSNGKTATCKVTSNVVLATAIKLNHTETTINKGNKLTLTATLTPSDATSKITWKSSNTSVATVTQKGVITAVGTGTATITATTSTGKKDTCKVIVQIPVTEVTLNTTNKTLKVNDTYTLVPTIKPSNATDKTVIWESSKSSIATVDENGKVKALKKGTTIITATSNGKKATCQITVTVPVESITLNSISKKLRPKESYQLKATVNPSNATDRAITWSSSNTKIATVDETGMVTIAATAGNNKTVTITAKTSNGITATCKITVYKLTNNYNSKDQKQYEILTRCNGKNSGAATTCGTQTSTTNSSDVRIHFINVGKGDATLLEINGKYGMIDVGSAKKTTVDGAGNPTVESTTYIEGVLGTTKKLSFIIATHNHGDHEGMMPQIIEKFADKNTKYYYRQSPVSAANIKINNNTSMDVSNSSDTYEEGIENEKEEAAEEQDEISDSSKSTNFVRKTYCNSITSIYNCSGKKYNNLIEVTNKNGTSFTIDDVEIQLLSVEEAFLDESSCIVKYNDGSEEKIEHEYSYQECNELSGKTINNKKVSSAEYYSDTENRNSLGALITYTNSSGNKIRTIITGDMYEGDEGRVVQELQNLGVNKIDIHKYGHHGTWQAGTLEYLSYIKPTYSIISTSDNSIHGRATNPGNYCYMQRNFGTKIYSTSEMKTTNEIVTSIDQRNYLVEGAIVFDLKKVGQNNYEPDVYKVKKNSNGKITGIEKDSVLKNKIKIEVNNDKTCSKTTYTGFMKNLNYGIQGATYYINSSGDFYKGTLNLGDDTYHFENNRAFMRINFFYRPRNIRYYFGSDGKMVKNKCLNISGVVHCFNASGQLKCSDKVTEYCVNE